MIGISGFRLEPCRGKNPDGSACSSSVYVPAARLELGDHVYCSAHNPAGRYATFAATGKDSDTDGLHEKHAHKALTEPAPPPAEDDGEE